MSLNPRCWLNSYFNKSSYLLHLIQKGASYAVHIQDMELGLHQAKSSNIRQNPLILLLSTPQAPIREQHYTIAESMLLPVFPPSSP